MNNFFVNKKKEGEILLENLKDLRTDMIKKEKGVIIFSFNYRNINYYIAVCLLTEEDKRKKEAKYALVKLSFIHQNEIDNYLDCYANSKEIKVEMTKLRKFLGVEYQKDGIGWLNGFYNYLGKKIPTKIPKQNNEKIAINIICRNEGRDPNRIYRNYIFRNGIKNGKQKHRTEYNAQLASFRFPILYKRFKPDKTISFAFTDNKELEKSEEEILKNFVKNEN